MTDSRIVNDLDCSESTFWDELFFDPEFNRRMFLDELKFTKWQVLSTREVGEVLERELDVGLNADALPAAAKSVIGDSLGYREQGKYDRKRRRYAVKATNSKLGDKFLLEGEMHTEPLGEQRCRRIFELKVTVKLFGVGGMIEKLVLSELQKSYAESATFIGRYMREKAAK
jgi:hypothetical protein